MIVYSNFSHSVEDNGDGTFDVLLGDQGLYQGTFESREYAERAADALEEDGEPNPGRRRWTVRRGTDGQGPILFEVYATTMEEARDSVERTAEENRESLLLGSLTAVDGFTVHAIERAHVGAGVLAGNFYVDNFPAPDFPRELAASAEDIIPSAATHTFG